MSQTCQCFKKTLQHRCFPVNFGKFLRTLFSHNTSGRLLKYLLNEFFLLILCWSFRSTVFLFFITLGANWTSNMINIIPSLSKKSTFPLRFWWFGPLYDQNMPSQHFFKTHMATHFNRNLILIKNIKGFIG